MIKAIKPLGYKSYGSIPHLPGSRLGEGDHHCHDGQSKIATEKVRDKHDLVIVQEKLDGGNVGVVKLNGEILAISRAGYLAESSPYPTHHAFNKYVIKNKNRFSELLNEGERVCGEWLLHAVGTRYELTHEPFVPFDLITGKERAVYSDFVYRINKLGFVEPRLLHIGKAFPIDEANKLLNISGHGALEETEGAIWRVERKGKVDFLCKFVKHSKVDGKYLDQNIINKLPNGFEYLTQL
jgi:ATP-dependent RNA circularization protein (DNA/RNA ligase family)